MCPSLLSGYDDVFFNPSYVHLRCHGAFAYTVLAPEDLPMPPAYTWVTPLQLSDLCKLPFLIRE